MKFKKRPVIVNAWPIAPLLKNAASAWKQLPEEVREAYEQGIFVFCSDKICIKTLEGNMVGLPSDWLIQGVKGEFYPCKPDIFEKTYEAVG